MVARNISTDGCVLLVIRPAAAAVAATVVSSAAAAAAAVGAPSSRLKTDDHDQHGVLALAPVAVALGPPVAAPLTPFFQGTGFTPSKYLLSEQGRLNMFMARPAASPSLPISYLD